MIHVMDEDEARAALSSTTSGWGKSSFSGGQNGCMEFNFTAARGWVGVRDSKLGDASPVLVFNETELNAMVNGAKAGEFDNRIR